ncbi:MAG: hypothetical protein ACXWZ7_09830 [Gemmatirosa sp.]
MRRRTSPAAPRRARRLSVIAALLLAGISGACRDATGTDDASELSIALAPARIACAVGDTAVVSATVANTSSEAPTITFAASDAGTVVAATGATARVRCAASGTTTVTVTAADGARRGQATLPVQVMRPQTLVLFATPKILSDFASPDADVARFLAHYAPLTSRAAKTILILAVGNSQHVLTYRGAAYRGDRVEWARYTEGKPVPRFDRALTYDQIAAIVRAFRARAAVTGVTLEVYDQVDPGNEFTFETFKYNRHPECMDFRWESYDVRRRLRRDDHVYASAPQGIAEGTSCGAFLVDQADHYLRDLGFDGILYGNQFGTRGRWLPDNGPGYSMAEADGIREFLDYSRRVYGDRGLMWFDSYNNVRVERETFSFPADGYRYFDYLIASGFCVITDTERYADNLASKLALPNGPRVLATLDYVDPWYTYNSMTAYPGESARLEQIAIANRTRIDGVVFFANDEVGNPVPRALVESFATRFYGAD